MASSHKHSASGSNYDEDEILHDDLEGEDDFDLDFEFDLDSESESEDESETDKESRRRRNEPHQLRDLCARFTKPLDAPDLDISLCPRCRLMDLATVFESADTGEDLNGAIIANLAPFTEANTDHTCRLCSFLLDLTYDINSHWKSTNYPWKLCAFDSLTIRGFPSTWANNTETFSIALTLVPDGLVWLGIEKTSAWVIPIDLSETRTQQCGRLIYRARELLPSSINYGLIKKWLRDCDSRHNGCQLQRQTTKPLQLIDCLQRSIVASTPSMEYFALSYVWINQLEVDKSQSPDPGNGNLPDDIPGLILDAMVLVQSLGYRYLWVDRYCIDQADTGAKRLQISLMDEIYEGALATVIASSSKAANRAVPGISISRTETPSVHISETVRLRTIRTMEDALVASEWNSRGWTYQEFCLSRRCLILADDQVHFICKWGTTSEGLQEADLSDLPFGEHRCLNSRRLEESHPAMDLGPNFGRELIAYTQRVLSHESDMLNAFRGMLSRSRLASYWGVPVFHIRPPRLSLTDAKWRDLPFYAGFALGLCWTASISDSDVDQAPIESLSKIQGLPSWSWVSSRCTIKYSASLTQDMKDGDLSARLQFVHYFPQIYLEVPSKTNREKIYATMGSPGTHSRVIPERSPYIYIRSVVKAIPTERWSQLQRWIDWDSGQAPQHLDASLRLILLICIELTRDVPTYHYMVVTMQGDIASRVGLLDNIYKDLENSLVTVHKMKTVKVG